MIVAALADTNALEGFEHGPQYGSVRFRNPFAT
jgi:hypothetical protein